VRSVAPDRDCDLNAAVRVAYDHVLGALPVDGLTSVRVDYAEFGSAATAALLAILAGREAPAYKPSRPEFEVRGPTSAPNPNLKI
jgi:hypothetical protein